MAQDAGRTMKPNYSRIAKEVKKADGAFFLDSLEERFARCDTSLTVDHLRCLYFAPFCEGVPRISPTYQRYLLLCSRFGRQSRQANTAWTQYQMLLTAVWSTGDGSRRKPLHVGGVDDAAQIIASDGHGRMSKRVLRRWRGWLLHYEALDEGDYDVWFFVRK